jgi:hypothetical protein
MEAKWCFISGRRISSRNRLTPPPEVREKITGYHQIDGKCIYWNYDPETDFALISNTKNTEFLDFGRSSLEADNTVTPDAGLVDAAFESLSEDDYLLFLGTDELLSGDQKHLFMLHEKQVYDLIKDIDNLK